MLDALRQVVHLRAYAQKKPIDEYKHEAFSMFERMLAVIREDVTGALGRAEFSMQPQDYPDMAEYVTHHIDPFSGDDDTYDIDAGTGAIVSKLPRCRSRCRYAGGGGNGRAPSIARALPCVSGLSTSIATVCRSEPA